MKVNDIIVCKKTYECMDVYRLTRVATVGERFIITNIDSDGWFWIKALGIVVSGISIDTAAINHKDINKYFELEV